MHLKLQYSLDIIHLFSSYKLYNFQKGNVIPLYFRLKLSLLSNALKAIRLPKIISRNYNLDL